MGLATATSNAEKNRNSARELFNIYLNSIFEQSKPLLISRDILTLVAKQPRREIDRPAPSNPTSATRTGGRAATTRHIEGKRSLCVGMPTSSARRGWSWRALDKLARMESGHTPSRRHPEYWGGDVPWIGIRDAKSAHGREIVETLEHTNALGLANSSARLLPARTVCLSRTASVGYVTVMGRPMATSQDFVNWVCSDALYPRFLMYLFLAQGDEIFKFSSGAVHQTIYFPEAKAFHICLPSIEEQREIVGMLDALREQTEKLEGNYQLKLADLTETKQAILQKAFLGELTSSLIYTDARGTLPSGKVSLTSIRGISPTDLHAGIIAIAYQKHQGHPKQNTFGHVKAEKISHIVEARVGIELDRNPIKDAAGPNDYRHLKKVESRAEKAGFFSVRQSAGGGYTFVRKRRFDEPVRKTRKCLGQYNDAVDAVIDDFLPMDTQQAEIFATVYAAWNNLLIEEKDVTDEAIVREARDNWHPEKLRIAPKRFLAAINWMRTKGIVPTGSGKKVLDRV